MFVVFDLDGTLALNEHRLHYIEGEKKDWDGFFLACGDDAPNLPVIETYKALRDWHYIEIWSGRGEIARTATNLWLTKHNIDFSILRMRQYGDFTPDDQLKEQWLKLLVKKPDLVFDDRQKVVDMWRRNDIVCCQVAPGSF